MSDEIAICAEHVYKNFVLPHEKVNSVKSLFTGAAKKREKKAGKETQHALEDVTFEIKKGEFFGIVGRNGSGKSTMLKILAGIYQPTSGKTYTNGKLVPFIELGVGFNPELTGRENVYLNGAMLGFSRQEIDAMYDDIVAFAEIERFMDQKLKNYSSGMQVRLAFSMATRSEADILLVDEVLAVGDTDFQAKCFNYFKELKRNKKTVVFVSHDMNAIREYCDRAILIDQSALVAEGTAYDVAGKYSELFMDNKSQVTTKDTQERRGDGSITILDPEVAFIKDELHIKFSLRCDKAVNDPAVGYYLVNDRGLQVCGTNTQLLGVKLEPIKKGSSLQASFRLNNVLSDGKYSLTIAVLSNSGSIIADWWANAVEVSVKKPQHISYLVDIPTKFSIEKPHD